MTNRMKWVGFGLCALMVLTQTTVFGETVTDFGAKEIESLIDKFMGFAFTTVFRAVGVFGAIGSIIWAFLHNSPKTILSFGSISLCCVFLPSFINGVFKVSGMLLP